MRLRWRAVECGGASVQLTGETWGWAGISHPWKEGGWKSHDGCPGLKLLPGQLRSRGGLGLAAGSLPSHTGLCSSQKPRGDHQALARSPSQHLVLGAPGRTLGGRLRAPRSALRATASGSVYCVQCSLPPGKSGPSCSIVAGSRNGSFRGHLAKPETPAPAPAPASFPRSRCPHLTASLGWRTTASDTGLAHLGDLVPQHAPAPPLSWPFPPSEASTPCLGLARLS